MTTMNSRPNPYVGPRSFLTGEKLYGRDIEARELLNLLIAERIVLLHSPSGAGKSSLVQAGLIPRLEEEGFRVLPVVRVNLEPPGVITKTTTVNRYSLSVMLSLEEGLPDDQQSTLEQLTQLSLTDYLAHFPAAERDGQAAADITDCLIFDQFEEVLTVDTTDREAKLEFFAELGKALRERNRWALFVMREDYLPALDPYLRPIPTRLSTTYRLDFLHTSAARQAIQQPVQEQGVQFASAAVDKLVNDLRQVQVQQPDGTMELRPGPYVEPVQLQVVCYHLWQQLPSEQMHISEEDISAIGNVDQSLAEYYAERVAVVAQRAAVRERSVREWFDRQLITEGGIRGQVLMEPEESKGLANRAIRLLEDAHLIRAEKRLGATWFELAHDRLIQPVRGDNAVWFLANLSLLERQASLWEKENRPEHLLLRDQALLDVEDWAANHLTELTSVEIDFLKECRDMRNQEMAERERAEQAVKLDAAQKVAEAERQRAEDQALAARKLRRRAVFLAIAFAIAVVMTGIAGFLFDQANQQRVIAVEQRNVAETQSRLAEDNAATAEYERGRAEAQQMTAEAASTVAVEQRNLAQTAQVDAESQRATAVEAANQLALAQDEIIRQRDIALSRQRAALALGYLGVNPELAYLLGIEAYRTEDTQEAKSALLTSLQRGLSQTVKPYGAPIPQNSTGVYAVALSPDGERIAWGGEDGQVIIRNYQTNTPEHSLRKHQSRVWSVAFSPDGKTLAAAGDDSWVYLWDVLSGDLLLEIPNRNKVVSVTWSPDGERLAVATGPNVVVWSLFENGAFKARISERDLSMGRNLGFDVNAVAWSPDGTQIAAACSDFSLYTLDPVSGNTVGQYSGHQGKVKSVAWSPDGKRLASGGEDFAVYLWDAQTAVGDKLEGHTDTVLSVAFSYDGQLLASSSEDDDKRVILWDVQTQVIKNQLSENSRSVESVSFLPRGGDVLLATGSRDTSVGLFEVISEQPLSLPLAAERGQILAVGVDAQANPLFARYRSNVLDVILLVNGAVQAVRENVANFRSVTSVAFAPGAQQIALGLESGMIQVVDLVSGETVSSWQGAARSISALAYSADGRRLASADCEVTDNSQREPVCTSTAIRLWNASNGAAEPMVLSGQSDLVTALAFSADGGTLASGSKDRTIWFWDLASGEVKGLPLTRHLGGVTSLAYSPDGKTLASGGDDQVVILWDAATSQPIGARLSGSTGVVAGLAFSADSLVLYSGNLDGSSLMWDVDLQAWVERACNLAGRNLTPAEWRQFFQLQQQRPTCEQWPLAAGTPEPAPAGTPTPSP